MCRGTTANLVNAHQNTVAANHTSPDAATAPARLTACRWAPTPSVRLLAGVLGTHSKRASEQAFLKSFSSVLSAAILVSTQLTTTACMYALPLLFVCLGLAGVVGTVSRRVFRWVQGLQEGVAHEVAHYISDNGLTMDLIKKPAKGTKNQGRETTAANTE